MRGPAGQDSDGVLKHDWEKARQDGLRYVWHCKNCGYTLLTDPCMTGMNYDVGDLNCLLRQIREIMES